MNYVEDNSSDCHSSGSHPAERKEKIRWGMK